MTSISVVAVTDRELDVHRERATREVQSFPFRAPKAAEAAPSKDSTATLGGRQVSYRPLQRVAAPAPTERDVSLTERIRQISAADELYTDVEHHVVRVLRRGIQVYLQIYRYYEEASGLDRLKAANRSGSLARDAETELAEKVETASAASLFCLFAYIVAVLSRDEHPEREAAIEPSPSGPLPLGSQSGALRAGLHAIHGVIDAHARDDETLVAAVREAARDQAEKLATLQGSLQHLEFFTRYHYRIEPEEVLLTGFELPESRVTTDIQVQTKRPEEVVGNHVAKLEASRIAQRLVCYDARRQANPFVDLGGFVFSFIGDGSPGTGKTTLIQMIVSLLREYAEVAGLPLRYQNFSIDEISDYQGRSGQNAKRFFRNVLDPRVVGFGTVDDVDQVCGNRNDRNASAGQLEVTAVFMQELGGANTIVRGNATFGLFSNYPEKVDDALRQRTQTRFQVDGPVTRDDFTDLLHILLGSRLELPLGEGYEPLVSQEIRRVIERKYAEHDVPKTPSLRDVYEQALGRNGGAATSWQEFGAYLFAIKQHDARFTGRAIKNISDAVQARMMDFDLPAEWLEHREPFFGQPYERRVEMIRELRSDPTPEMVLQEIHRYADSESRYGDAADERELAERIRQLELDTRARRAHAERDR